MSQEEAQRLEIMRRCRRRSDRARLHGDFAGLMFWTRLEAFISSKAAAA